MLRIVSFTFNPFQENTYLIVNSRKECWIVDPGMYDEHEQRTFLEYIRQQRLTPKMIINTHAHIDHIFSVQDLKKKFRIPFGIHASDLPVLQGAAASASLFGFSFKDTPDVDFFIAENKPLQLGTDVLEVRLTPGHSPGSISFYSPENKFVLSGDVLFYCGIGRSDLPGGDAHTLLDSIRTELYTLPENTVVYPGHGPVTQVGYEKRSNPFVRGR